MIAAHFASSGSLEINLVLMKVHKQESRCSEKPPMPPLGQLAAALPCRGGPGQPDQGRRCWLGVSISIEPVSLACLCAPPRHSISCESKI